MIGPAHFAMNSKQTWGLLGVMLALNINSACGQQLFFSIAPDKTAVRVKENFKVSVRLANLRPALVKPAQITQTIRLMSCSWYDQLDLKGPADLHCVLWPCEKNTETTIQLPPGSSWTNELEMCLSE